MKFYIILEKGVTMKKLMIIFISSFVLLSCNNKPEHLQRDYISEIFPAVYVSEEKGLYADSSGDLMNGTFSSSHNNGAVHAKLAFSKGMITDGYIRNKDGSLHSDYSSNQGLFYHTIYQEGGEPKVLTVYEDNYHKHTEFYVWYEDGTPFFLLNNRFMTRMWYENGQLQLQTPLKNGKMDGKALAWHKNGKLKAENHFTDDQMDGSFKEWDSEGNLIREGTYEMGQLITEK